MRPTAIKTLQKQLLRWYDRHQRVMPWRAVAGKRPDPYHVWLSEIMLQQTTVVTVGPYFKKFLKKWPRIQKLAAADLDDVLAAWAGLGYYARARNLHKCAIAIVEDYDGQFPEDAKALQALPGIGPYTAAAISSIAFDHEACAVDGNVERVVSRFFAIRTPLPASKDTLRKKAQQLTKGNGRPGDFTQAFMELGATVCTPRKPKCALCPWRKDCKAHAKGIAENLPMKTAKPTKPLRYGRVFWAQRNNGAFLIHKRAGRGLFQGMYQLPTTDWIEDPDAVSKLATPFVRGTKFRNLKTTVRHSFTHFDLILEIWEVRGPARSSFETEIWLSPESMDNYALPTLMKKAVKLCMKSS